MVVEYEVKKSRVVVIQTRTQEYSLKRRAGFSFDSVFLFSLFSASLCLSQNGYFQEGVTFWVSHFALNQTIINKCIKCKNMHKGF